MDGGGLHVRCARPVGHNLSLFTRAAFDEIGGYPALSLGEDAEIDQALLSREERNGGTRSDYEILARNAWFYIYRWGVSPAHLSGSSDMEFWGEIGSRPIQEGRFVLHPHWRSDYEASTQRLIALLDAQNGGSSGQECAASLKIEGTADELTVVPLDKLHDDPVQSVMLFVLGGAGPKRTLNLRDFPRSDLQKGEPRTAHLVRVVHQIDDVIAVGGTHLLVPREAADWLGDNPLLVDYFAEQHDLVEASREMGIVFALRR